MLEPEVGKKFKTDAKVTIKTVTGQIIKGTINIGINSNFSNFIKEDIHRISVIAVYNAMKMGRTGHDIFVNVGNIEYISPQKVSEPEKDMLLTNINIVHISVYTINGNTIIGDINLGMNKRVSDRLREIDHYLPLFNVYTDSTTKRTVYINKNKIESAAEIFK